MADTGNWFKFAPFGGFRRQDVITYIEALLKEHNEEKEAYRAGADLLRRERDEARERLTAMQTQLEEMNKRSLRVPSLQSDMDSLKAHVVQLASDKTRLSETLQKMEGAREADRAALSQMKFLLSDRESRLVELQARLNEFETAYLSAEDLGLKARERTETVKAEALAKAAAAEKAAYEKAAAIESEAVEKATAIETEAAENAEHSRELISRLWLETKARYAALSRDAEGASATAARELDRARQLLVSAGRMFDGVNSRLENLPVPEKAVSQETAVPEPSSLELLLAQQRNAQSEQEELLEVETEMEADEAEDEDN